MNDKVIETQGLTVYYGKQRGIIDVDLVVKRGEVYGFLGPNGAGKTTTLRVLMDVIRPNRGKASIFGLDCRRQGVEIRSRVGYVPGELTIYPNMRARHYLNMVDSLRPQPANGDYRRHLCALLDLDLSRRIKDFSRGNKQKLGLVAAFMHKPDLLILDEPTGGLDPLMQQVVLDLVREAQSEQRTVFFSSHALSEVQAVCDRVGVIRGGRLVAVERVAELMQRGLMHLNLTFDREPPAEILLMPGVLVLGRDQNTITFEVQNNLQQLMQVVAPYGVNNIETLQLTLEQIFLAYYGKGEGATDV